MATSHLWDISTHWHTRIREVTGETLYAYQSWKDLMMYKPWKMWKPYDLIGWSWDKENKMLQIVFFLRGNLQMRHYIEVPVREDEEDSIRQWLKRHMPKYWQI